MTQTGEVAARPFLLEGARGWLLATYFAPVGGAMPRGDILFVPPFGEEMNRCRAMVAMQARDFARHGIGTLVVDPYGTGDSAGEFADATWDTWRDDIGSGLAWLRSRGNGCRALWGVRLGALMAAQIAAGEPGIEHLLLWQPVLNGKTFYTQFLRIRIAADLEQAGGVKSTDELRQRSAAGECVEVSGYRVGPDLARALDEATMPDLAALPSVRTTWLEVLPSADAVVPRASTRAVDDLRAAGASVDFESVVGPPFWQVHEREIAPQLIAATTRTVGTWEARPAAPVVDDRALEVEPGPEVPVVFPCGSDQLVGVLHRGDPNRRKRRGVVVVVAGGPQYRAGAHRQFVSLARKLAHHGHPVLRFDLRGMGDSSGEHVGFQRSEPDIRSAVDALLAQAPHVDEVVLFGECESASGILFYAWRDARVRGIALVNPWVRTEEGQAQVIIKHYYLDRLRSPEFWRSVREGRFDVRRSLASLVEVLRAYFRGRRAMARSESVAAQDDISGLPLPLKTAAGLRRFTGQVMLLMSGRDYIAREFDEVTSGSKAWAGLLDSPRICRRDLVEADHTFSREPWKNRASDWVVEWLAGW